MDKERHLLFLNTIFITILIVCNFVSSKLTVVCGLVFPVGTIGYAITFLVTDIVGELYDEKESNRVVMRGFVAIVISYLFAELCVIMPSLQADEAYNRIFGSAMRVMAGSICGYLASQTLDVFIFHKIKKLTNGRFKWIRNNIGTIVSQIVDTVVFTLIAFGGLIDNIYGLMIDLIIVKIALAILDTPFFYFFTRRQKNESSSFDCDINA